MRRVRWARDVARMERREMQTEFWCRNVKERDHLEDLGVNGGTRLKCFLIDGVDCIYLAQDWDKCPVFVMRVMKIRD
jgi:hypothetical protein